MATYVDDKLTGPAVQEKLSEKELCPDELLAGQEAAFARDIERLQARRHEFVTVPCPACVEGGFLPTLEKFTFQYVTCQNCGTLFMNPRPSVEVMAAYYADSENYRYWAEHIFPASEAARREKVHRPWLEKVAAYCQRYGVPQGVLLEIGAGFGTFAALATESGNFEKVLAVEPTPQMAQACRERGVEVIAKRLEDISGEVAETDVAVAFEVVEHLFEPRRFLLKVQRLLKPGGLLVLSCPNGQGFDIAMLGSVSLAIDPEHVNLFNPHSLTLLVEGCGFKVLEVSTPGRLDAEFVHTAIKEGKFPVPRDPFLKRVLVEEWDRLGWPFQMFLAAHGLSSHMWLVAVRR